MKFLSKSILEKTDLQKISDSLKRIESEQISQRIDISRVLNQLRQIIPSAINPEEPQE